MSSSRLFKVAAVPARSIINSSLARPVIKNIPQFSARYFAATKDEPFLDPKLVADRIIEVVKNFEKVTPGKVTATARFKEDLELDSLDAVEVVMAIEEEFCVEIPDAEADNIFSISDAVKFISAHPMAK